MTMENKNILTATTYYYACPCAPALKVEHSKRRLVVVAAVVTARA